MIAEVSMIGVLPPRNPHTRPYPLEKRHRVQPLSLRMPSRPFSVISQRPPCSVCSNFETFPDRAPGAFFRLLKRLRHGRPLWDVSPTYYRRPLLLYNAEAPYTHFSSTALLSRPIYVRFQVLQLQLTILQIESNCQIESK